MQRLGLAVIPQHGATMKAYIDVAQYAIRA